MNDDTYFELPAPEVFGPQGAHVAALLERARHLTPDEASELDNARDAVPVDALDAASDAELGAARGARGAAWDAARGAAWDAARGAARDAAWGAWGAWGAARAAALDAAGALVVRDLIPAEDYDTLTRTWRTVIGPIHPEDEFWAAVAKAAK